MALRGERVSFETSLTNVAKICFFMFSVYVACVAVPFLRLFVSR